MIVSIAGESCYIYREPTDSMFGTNRSKSSWSPPGSYGAESRLLYHVQRVLNARDRNLIKKRLWKDGHLFGSDHSQYLRSRDLSAVPSMFVYHANAALEIAAESYNILGRVELDVKYGVGRENDPNFEQECREWMARKENAHSCYEVSWEGEVVIDGSTATRRLYRGFTSLDEARAFLATDPGEYSRLIDRRTGERVAAPCFA